MNFDPTDEDRDFAADILEQYAGDAIDVDRMGEVIAEVAHAFAYIRGGCCLLVWSRG